MFHQNDPVFQSIDREYHRQCSHIELIASENFVSADVRAAQGSVLTNKYAEGYPGRRYYGGCAYVDEVERLAIDRAKLLFGANFANVQSHSGAQANLAAFMAFMKPGDGFLGMALDSGGHLTHGASVTLSGQWFKPVHYTVHRETGLLDYTQIQTLAEQHRPKLIIAGGSAYARQIDFQRFRSIADSVGAYLMVDMAHVAGLVAGGAYPSPIPHAHIVTSTTHKTLRGPRGGLILWQDDQWTKPINSAVFPGCQGGPLMHVIAAKAVSFGEALQPAFQRYAHQTVEHAKLLEHIFAKRGISMVSSGTESHLLLLDLRGRSMTGAQLTHALESVGIVCNKNSIPFDPQPPHNTSGIRIGTPAMTTRGLGIAEFQQIGEWISDMIEQCGTPNEIALQERIRQQVAELCQRFPIP